MHAKAITPILNVSNIAESFAWFERFGWRKGWEWGEPPSFGGVCSGDVEIFLCQNGQGGRGRSALSSTAEDDTQERGVWISIWVDDVDAMYRKCLEQKLDVTKPPADEPWRVREMHVRHPDGHVFRVGKGIELSDSTSNDRATKSGSAS